ncbi:gas vesicle protein [Streptomyces sp. SID14478]|uniref:gas vesicle protein GvpO n=1 Tax=Streptomyces sp. SID14478 TaxID=2706073 RepID=UPI0013DF87F1|nr:gas vesicle protein GvpO [Streptomyces sp. SID14478]NEB81951.1 gas vesicle protein [Streptomyces sp. SID14478]
MTERSRRPQAATSRSRPRAEDREAPDLRDLVQEACRTLTDLIGYPAEGVSAVCPTESDGWRVSVDVLEVARIPDTTSLLATYDVELDAHGRLKQYRRVRRYRRGWADS